jgi:subtilisin-like proprotein convertase family protein
MGACAEAGDNPIDPNDDPDAGVVDPPKEEDICDDKIDNDEDGLEDCEDDDCANLAVCLPELSCNNGFDDDMDGVADCQDEDCDGNGICEYLTEVSCTDGTDNDGDSLMDCADADCVDEPTCNPEGDCTDGQDNDEDGRIDCLDTDCDMVGICEFGTELSCLDGEDNDGDGDMDCLDSNCSSGIQCLLSCPATTTAMQFDSTEVPLAIPDSPGMATVTSMAMGSDTVAQAAVQVDIAHTWAGDLILTLIAPNNDRIILSNRNGGSADNYAMTIFADGAAGPISAGTPPFTGSFQPDEPLESLVGDSGNGTWSLEVSDNAGGDTGTINQFSMHLCVCTDCEVGAACLDMIDNDNDMLTDCEDPDCSSVIQCIPETMCDDVLDNDLDSLVDCLDDDCDTIGICEFDVELTCDDNEDNDGDGGVDCGDTDCDVLPVCLAEVDCHDMIDNDNDGDTDCQDVGCSSDPTCEINGETICNDGIDNDSDGLTDCEEAVCAGLIECVAVCPMGDTSVQLVAADLPQNFTDLATTTSTINNGTAGTISKVAVEFSATHTFDGDLDIFLVSPAATSVELSTDNGSLNDNYTDTVFVDGAATSIINGVAPFTGPHAPEFPLSGFNGEAAAGDWQLQVTDDAGADTGTFDEFQLILCITP